MTEMKYIFPKQLQSVAALAFIAVLIILQHIVQVPLAVISEWELLHCSQDEIYIVENPSVFAVLCGKEKEENTRRAYMCMNGQPRLAGLMVLELLAKSGTRVYYAGDLDPEGILIAQKLSRYYKGDFHYWHMETEDYEKCKSEEVISPKRMKILERITDDRLKPVVERIKAYGTAGYQEMLMVLQIHADIRPDIFIPGTTKYTIEELREILKNKEKPIFVAVDEADVCVGYAFCQLQEQPVSNNMVPFKSFYIDDLCVDQEARGQHIGESLFEHVKKEAKQRGCYEVTLNVWTGNTSAEKFYERMGMRTKKRQMEYTDL